MFNPLMALIVASISDRLEEKATVIEFGNQTFSVSKKALEAIASRLAGSSRANRDALDLLSQSCDTDTAITTEAFYRALGFSEYRAIDVNDKFGSLVMDLNKDLHASYNYREIFSLVTNNGTGEHIFDQATLFRNMHNLTKRDGFMVHVMPWSGINLLNHGFFRFEPGLYFDLAEANQYRLIAAGIADRWGYGVEAESSQDLSPRSGADSRILLTSHRIDLASFYRIPDCRYRPIRALVKRAKYKLRRTLGLTRHDQKSSRLQQLEITHALRSIARPSTDLLIFAVLQKLGDGPFRVPFQNKYTDAIKGEEIRVDYSAQSKKR